MNHKNIVLVGGNSGIGAAILKTLVQEEYSIWAMSRTANEKIPQMADTNDDIDKTDLTKVKTFDIDILEENPNFPEITEPLNGLIYCPGSINLKPFKNLKIKDFQKDLDVNFFGLLKTLDFYLENLKKSENSPASIVLFSTVAVQTGMAFHTSVAAAKGAVEGFARALAAELAPDIRVNVIAPSLTDTPMAERLLRNDKQRTSAINRHPLKRIGTPKDLAQIVRFLISDESTWITGQVLQVDGGLSSIKNL